MTASTMEENQGMYQKIKNTPVTRTALLVVGRNDDATVSPIRALSDPMRPMRKERLRPSLSIMRDEVVFPTKAMAR